MDARTPQLGVTEGHSSGDMEEVKERKYSAMNRIDSTPYIRSNLWFNVKCSRMKNYGTYLCAAHDDNDDVDDITV